MKLTNDNSVTRESPSGNSPSGFAAFKKTPAKTFSVSPAKMHNVTPGLSAFEKQALAEMEWLDTITAEQVDELADRYTLNALLAPKENNLPNR